MSKSKNSRIALEIMLAIVLVLVLHGIFICLSGKGFQPTNPYNSYSKQCASWLEGRLDLGQNYQWLELAVYNGKYFVSFPPFPSYVLLPFVAIFGENTPDLAIALLSVLIGVLYSVRIANKFCTNSLYVIMLPVFFYCGTAVWQITVDSGVWYMAQNFAMTLSIISFYYAISGYRGRSLFFLVCAAGCRPFQIIYFPLIIYFLFLHCNASTTFNKLRELFFNRFWTYIPAILLGSSYLLLNLLRFNNPFEFGHNYLPEFTNSELGQFNISYVVSNLPSLFRLPTFDEQTHILTFPAFNGMNIFIAFPVLIWYIYMLLIRFKYSFNINKSFIKINLLGILLIFIHIFCILMHKTMGGAHFGNRYISDILPCVFVCLCFLSTQRADQNFADKRIRKIPFHSILDQFLFQILLLSGMLINFTGLLNSYALTF